MKTTIPHDQHAFADRAEQSQATHTLGGVVRPKTGIADGVRATFTQVDGAHLGESTVTPRTVLSPKILGLGGRIRHILGRPVHRHQTQPKQKRIAGVQGCQRLADFTKHGDHRRDTQLLASLANRTRARRLHVVVRTKKAWPLQQLGQPIVNRFFREQVHSHAHQHRQYPRQFSGTLFHHAPRIQHTFNTRPRQGMAQSIQGGFLSQVDKRLDWT